MRLDLLFAREPFADIFINTLGGYLARRFSWHGKISWSDSSEGYKNSFLVHDKLNLIYPGCFPSKHLREIACEYIYHPNSIRHTLQWLYVQYSVVKPFRNIIACAHINMHPWLGEMANWCILGGNHSLRIIDVLNNRSVMISKHGFNKTYLDAIVNLRSSYPELPGPRMIEWDTSEGWVVEERISGLPLNRISDKRLVQRALLQAQGALGQLYVQTGYRVLRDDWIDEKYLQIERAVRNLPVIYGNETRLRVLSQAEEICNILRQNMKPDDIVPTAVTHGDFQPANIIVPTPSAGDHVFIIDWEYTSRRCCWYDALVFELRSRFPAGLSQRVVELFSDSKRLNHMVAWCTGSCPDKFGVNIVIGSFLLDDLLLRVSDTSIPGLLQPDKGFMTFLDELSYIGLSAA